MIRMLSMKATVANVMEDRDKTHCSEMTGLVSCLVSPSISVREESTEVGLEIASHFLFLFDTWRGSSLSYSAFSELLEVRLGWVVSVRGMSYSSFSLLL